MPLQAPAPASEEPVAPAEEPASADAKSEEPPAPEPVVEETPVPAEPVKETEVPAPAESAEAPVPETTTEEPKKEDDKKDEKEEKITRSPLKIGRRLSARVSDLFKPSKSKEVNHPVKVDEAPPKIEEPAPVAPLENPAADSAPGKVEEPKKEETKEANEPPKIIDAAPAPVIATA